VIENNNNNNNNNNNLADKLSIENIVDRGSIPLTPATDNLF
jgi:hypothetical protein